MCLWINLALCFQKRTFFFALFFFFYLTVANTLLHGNVLPNKSTNERHRTRASHKHFSALQEQHNWNKSIESDSLQVPHSVFTDWAAQDQWNKWIQFWEQIFPLRHHLGQRFFNLLLSIINCKTFSIKGLELREISHTQALIYIPLPKDTSKGVTLSD